MLELVGAILGGLFRLAPEVMKYMDAGNERKHELARIDKQIELQKLTGNQKMEEARLAADSAFDTSAVVALSEAIKSQMQLTGIRKIDMLTFSVRPVVTYLMVGLYILSKVGLFVTAAMTTGTVDGFWKAVVDLYGVEDRAILAFILNFWFLGRVFERVRAG